MLAATPALAAGLSTSQAAQASAQAAKAVAKQTHASSVKVTGCTRSSSRKAICHAEAHYSTGARRCTFDLTVTQASAKGQRPRTSPSNFVCY
ncbi:MAG: hypothetical protein E6G62_11675 [Actinobacteria bacterium]|jgi:hypothetical protein|nr:MAG: hypothetical protein E6G62_11675 [Actinomycetota bacterium]